MLSGRPRCWEQTCTCVAQKDVGVVNYTGHCCTITCTCQYTTAEVTGAPHTTHPACRMRRCPQQDAQMLGYVHRVPTIHVQLKLMSPCAAGIRACARRAISSVHRYIFGREQSAHHELPRSHLLASVSSRQGAEKAWSSRVDHMRGLRQPGTDAMRRLAQECNWWCHMHRMQTICLPSMLSL